MSLGIVIFSILGGLGIAALLIWLLLLYFRSEDEKHKAPLILNFMASYAKGRALGLEVKTEKVNNRFVIEYQPRDVTDEELLQKTKLDNVVVVVDRNKVITLPQGTLSAYRDIKILLPPNAEDFSTELKQTLFGKVLMQLTEAIGAYNVDADVAREGSERKTKILKKLGDGEISEAHLEREEELIKQLIKNASSETKNTQNRPVGGFNPPNL